jgi:hypothetical protein
MDQANLILVTGATGQQGGAVAFGDDLAVMFKWFNEVGYNVDIPALEQRFGITLTKFSEVIATADWARE